MLGLASYQEALRSLGLWIQSWSGESGSATASETLSLEEDVLAAQILVTAGEQQRTLNAGQLEQILFASRGRRGMEASTPSLLSDLLRAVGFALDELRAAQVRIDMPPDRVTVRFRRHASGPVSPACGEAEEVTYADDDLEALRAVAAARRKGDPLRRVLVLHEPAPGGPVGHASAPIRDLLVAEFAVQDLPSRYAAVIAGPGEPPHVVLLHAPPSTPLQHLLETLKALRAVPRMTRVPIVVIGEQVADPTAVFQAGADDILPEPFAPAQLRARLRTWLLRGSSAA